MKPKRNRPATLAAAHGWAAIETAPKDGTKLMLWCNDGLEVGYWSTSLWVTRPADSPLGKQDGAWIIYENRSDTIELHPTHWMPLPLPPNDKSSNVPPKI